MREDGTLELQRSGDIENDRRDRVEDVEVDLNRSGKRQSFEISLDGEIVVLGTGTDTSFVSARTEQRRMQAPLKGGSGKDLHNVLAQAISGRCRRHLGQGFDVGEFRVVVVLAEGALEERRRAAGSGALLKRDTGRRKRREAEMLL